MSSPLYDIYDPDGELRRLAELRAIRENPLSPYRESLTDLLPEEEKRSMLETLSNAGSSGIGALGWILDTPGAVVRGGLSGGPSKALSALWESSDDRVTGRELLRQYNMVGEEDTWGNWLTGFAAEVGLDPFTYLNPLSLLGRGAYTNAGRALSKAGVLEDASLLARRQNKGVREYLRSTPAGDILSQYAGDSPAVMQDFTDAAKAMGLNADDLLSQKAATTMEFRVPGMKTGVPVSLTGGMAGDAVAKFLDAAGEQAKYSPVIGPLVNRTTRFFDTSVMGAVDPDSQWRNREAFSQARNSQRQVRQNYADLQVKAHAANTEHLAEGLRSFNGQRIQNAIADLIEAEGDTSKLLDQQAAQAVAQVPEWQAVVDTFTSNIQDALTEAEKRGVKLRKWGGNTAFFPSQKTAFDVEQLPEIPAGREAKRQRRYTSGQRALNLDDNLGRSRNPAYDLPMRRQTFRELMAGDAGRELQERLLAAGDDEAVGIIDEAWRGLRSPGGAPMYGPQQAAIAKKQQTVAELKATRDKMEGTPFHKNLLNKQIKKLEKDIAAQEDALRGYKVRVADQLRMADRQFADKGLGLFDGSSFNDMLRYDLGRAKVNANADAILDNLARISTAGSSGAVAGGGAVQLPEAARRLGFVGSQFDEAIRDRIGGVDPGSLYVTEKQIADLQQLLPQGPKPAESPLGKLYRSFTNAFKVGALANPSYHFRNLYSGQYATASQGIADPITLLANARAGKLAGRGDYTQVLARIKNIPRYQRVAEAARRLTPGIAEDKVDEAILQAFKSELARNRLGQGSVIGDVDGVASAPALFPGAGYKKTPWFGEGGLLYDPNRTYKDLFTVRGVDFAGSFSDRRAPQATRNPLLDLHERTSQSVEDMNRLGAYISALETGSNPDDAARLVYQSQIDYSPEAFTAGEAKLKQLVPFYSYPRGIAPLVASNTVYRPGGLQGQTIRAINRGGEGGEDYFVPDHLRKEASVPFPWQPENEDLQRFLTGIELPFVDVVNEFTPGTGNTPLQILLDSLQKTGVNLAGNLNPLPKMAIEGLFGKQLYSGRDLNDLYSVFEQSLGKDGAYLEQAVMNLVPGGSKIIPTYRTYIDERLTPAERVGKLLFNNLLGAYLSDVNIEATRQRVARNQLQRLLETTSGASTYENINVPEDELAKMGEQERRMYLLYRVLQADASKRARERKKAEYMQDPLQLLGVA